MKFCKDCKHYEKIDYRARFERGSSKIIQDDLGDIRFTKEFCSKVSEIEFDPISGKIINVKSKHKLEELRDKEPNTIYPRCGYEGKWFEPKGEIKS